MMSSILNENNRPIHAMQASAAEAQSLVKIMVLQKINITQTEYNLTATSTARIQATRPLAFCL